MEIIWQGHSCFQLRMDQLSILTDPFPESLGIRMNLRSGTTATIVTVSNPHPNHSFTGQLPGAPRIFRSPGDYEFRDIAVRAVMTSIPEGTPWEQRNVACSIRMDGITICHLGDIAQPLTTGQIEDLQPVDVLLLPTGGGCTLPLPLAAQAIQDLSPRIVIPMHHRIPGVEMELAPVEEFLQLLGGAELQPQPRLNVTQGSLPADQRVVVLNPRARVLNLHNGQEDQGEHPEPDEEPDLAGEGESQETELTNPTDGFRL